MIAGLLFIVATFTSIRVHDVKPEIVAILFIAGGALINQLQIMRSNHFDDEVRTFLADILRPVRSVESG